MENKAFESTVQIKEPSAVAPPFSGLEVPPQSSY